jgi:site-specific recombinase XerD
VHKLPSSSPLLGEYELTLANKAAGTVDAYMRALRKLTAWIATKPDSNGHFQPDQFTRTALDTYLAELERAGYSASYRTLVKAAASSFARWLIDEKRMLRLNPARGVQVPAQPLMAPRVLTDDQRYILRNLVERHSDLRGAAIFALGYWAGCRVSDVSWLQMDYADIRPRSGSLTVGHKGGKMRQIDLCPQARRPLDEYIQRGGRDPASPYVFTSQRAERLTEAGIHHWFRNLKAQATRRSWDFIHNVTFHDLRHDFAHRAREAGWTLEEIAYYLGHITRKGTPALHTTVRYTQASRQQVKDKLKLLGG